MSLPDSRCLVPKTLGHFIPALAVFCTLPLGHEGQHQTAVVDSDRPGPLSYDYCALVTWEPFEGERECRRSIPTGMGEELKRCRKRQAPAARLSTDEGGS